MDRAELRVSVAHGDDETIVAIAGELDMSTADRLPGPSTRSSGRPRAGSCWTWPT
jgi:hypothetical protein